MKRLDYVIALRELADFVEAHEFPETIQNWLGNQADTFDMPNLNLSARNKEDFGALCRALGSFTKERTEYSTGAVTTLPSGITVRVTTNRENVCRKIVVGKRIVPAKPEQIIEAEPEREVDVIEWECPESFISLGKETENVE